MFWCPHLLLKVVVVWLLVQVFGKAAEQRMVQGLLLIQAPFCQELPATLLIIRHLASARWKENVFVIIVHI